ncbi:hypothetical protein P4909_17820 [Escherichia coli]
MRQSGIFERYLVDIRQWDVVDKTKEERLGQRMDTALINLMTIPARLPEAKISTVAASELPSRDIA